MRFYSLNMNSFCILILAALCSNVAWAVESTTLSTTVSPSSPKLTSSSSQKSSAKVKRQYQFPFARPPNYSPYVGDAARQNADANAQTINQVDQKDLNGNYNYAYETTNGIKVRQTSYMVGNNRVVVGYYSYIGPDGKVYTTHYTADQFGYRATGSHLPVQDTAVQPLPFISSTPGPFVSTTPAPFISSSPAPFISSTPAPFLSSTPFSFNVPSSPAYPVPFPTTPSPIASSSTPFASTVLPLVSRRPSFPIYTKPALPFQGYDYYNPRMNTPYSVVSQQTPAPLYFQSSTESPVNRYSYITAPSNVNSRITTTLAPPPFSGGFNNFLPSNSSPSNAPVQFKEYIPPIPIQSTPRPFTPYNSFSSNEPGTVVITPKPSINQPQLPNTLSINENILPPYLSVGPLNVPPRPDNFPGENVNFIGRQPFEFNDQVRPLPQAVAPLTVTNLNFRKKRDFEK